MAVATMVRAVRSCAVQMAGGAAVVPRKLAAEVGWVRISKTGEGGGGVAVERKKAGQNGGVFLIVPRRAAPREGLANDLFPPAVWVTQ